MSSSDLIHVMIQSLVKNSTSSSRHFTSLFINLFAVSCCFFVVAFFPFSSAVRYLMCEIRRCVASLVPKPQFRREGADSVPVMAVWRKGAGKRGLPSGHLSRPWIHADTAWRKSAGKRGLPSGHLHTLRCSDCRAIRKACSFHSVTS